MSRSRQQQKPSPITDRNHILTFGKYKGETVGDVLDFNGPYLVWLHQNSDFFELGHELLEEAETAQIKP